MFGGSGDESSYSSTNPPFLSSDIWNGWVLSSDWNGNILNSHVFCQGQVNTATEYGVLIDNGFIIFNDTDDLGDEDVGVMKIINGSNHPNIRSGFHVDFHYEHSRTAIFYVNTNDGYTEFEDGTKIESKENRIVIFPTLIKHSGVTCTDQQNRVVINFNYIDE